MSWVTLSQFPRGQQSNYKAEPSRSPSTNKVAASQVRMPLASLGTHTRTRTLTHGNSLTLHKHILALKLLHQRSPQTGDLHSSIDELLGSLDLDKPSQQQVREECAHVHVCKSVHVCVCVCVFVCVCVRECDLKEMVSKALDLCSVWHNNTGCLCSEGLQQRLLTRHCSSAQAVNKRQRFCAAEAKVCWHLPGEHRAAARAEWLCDWPAHVL